MKYIANCSFGKDSLAMILMIIEKNYPIDEVVFYNTGMEFEQIYQMRDKLLPILKQHNIKYVELHPQYDFTYKMLYYPHYTRKGKLKFGYGWCGGCCRWGTTEKIRILDKYCKDSIQYIGIAYDETERWVKLAKTKNKLTPLVDWKLSEQDCLDYCYEHGFNWNGLYKILKRVSCWCCRNKNLKELFNYKKYLPNYFNQLVELEKHIGEPMKPPYYLGERFND